MTLSIIIINYNGASLLTKCLTSLRVYAAGIDHEVIVVDNASSDNSRELVRTGFPDAIMIENQENAGFSKANNLGAQAAQGEYLLFMNNDAFLVEESPATLIKFLDTHPAAVAVGPKLVFADGMFQLSCGPLPTFWIEAYDKLRYGIDRRLRRFSSHLHTIQARAPRPVGWVTGACMMVRANAFHAAGGFDEDIFMYFEDKDLCKRLHEAGGEIWYNPLTKVVHLLAGSASATTSEATRRHYRNSQRHYYAKHLSPLHNRLLRLYQAIAVRNG